MRVVFMGTPDFAVPCLESIINAGHFVAGVFTQPDKPKGRGYTLTPPPVKVCALSHNIEVYQPITLKDDNTFNLLKELSPEVIVVVAYGKILPKNILDLPKYGCINVHASLLPKYRGAAPIHWSIINGEKETGVTAMYMDVGLDTGDMILKKSVKIGENETTGELHDRLSELGAELITKTLEKLQLGNYTREKQNNDMSCYSPMINKSLGKIDWSKSAQEIHNLIRGLNPAPSAFTKFNNKNIKIYRSIPTEGKGKAGEVISLNPLTIACGIGAVKVLELQLEGKKRMKSEDFLRGYSLNIGDIFESLKD